MRLIDGHALMESLQKATSNAIKSDFAKGLLEAQRLTINAPTIDAVEVVRCKDCRYANECHKSVQYTRNELNTVTIGYSPIEWCSKGERREE